MLAKVSHMFKTLIDETLCDKVCAFVMREIQKEEARVLGTMHIGRDELRKMLGKEGGMGIQAKGGNPDGEGVGVKFDENIDKFTKLRLLNFMSFMLEFHRLEHDRSSGKPQYNEAMQQRNTWKRRQEQIL